MDMKISKEGQEKVMNQKNSERIIAPYRNE